MRGMAPGGDLACASAPKECADTVDACPNARLWAFAQTVQPAIHGWLSSFWNDEIEAIPPAGGSMRYAVCWIIHTERAD